ncbi:MAG TPA: CDF family Co(II)/Ni(II) efflux transporter DmeF [Gemmataceae bacterium]|nr:CDF family Co(II)/Ni(II) efflux transporter DmeF [Gemmataceae bacterium]
MHNRNLHLWQHDHAFAQDQKRPGEARTILVLALTGTMMVVEIVAGIVFGSMALLADGLHMASHAAALGIAAFAYIYARRHARDDRFSFGTGKVNALGGFTGAVLLAVFALLMASESLERFVYPVAIVFDQAILVAVLGLLVNGLSVVILGHRRHREHFTEKGDPNVGHAHHDHDHNLRAAYLHVLADTLTSLLAIFALGAGKYWGLIWMDPLMGLVGAVLVARWAWGLLRLTSAVLLDRQGPEPLRQAIKNSIEEDADNRVADLHLWSVGPGIYAAIVSVVTHDPKPPDYYKKLIPPGLGLVHVTVEVHRCSAEDHPEEVRARAVMDETVRAAD